MKSALSLCHHQKPGMMGNILVVDDQESVRKLVSIIVRSAGYAVIEAVDGEDALAQVAGKNIEMVITDLRMPNMDGIELVKCLRRIPEYRLTPAIMLSSEFLGNRLGEAYEAGVGDWVTKPFIRHHLLDSIKKALRDNDPSIEAAAAPL
jgi:two-component system chemotaxis response regulator CheY